MCSHISYRRWAGCAAAAFMVSTLVLDAQSPPKPRIVIVATGGTIAGAAESTTPPATSRARWPSTCWSRPCRR